MHLILFFARGISLKAWNEIGMFDREVALYKRLRDRGVSVSFVTYGNSDDLYYRECLPGIKILCNRWGLPDSIYRRFLHIIHAKALKTCDLIKTNQMNGADVVLRCAQFWRKPLICRMGYMWSEFVNYENGSVEKVKQLENNLFRSADRIIVTTNEMRENILERIPDSKAKTSVVPNYVETDRFTLNTDMLKEFDILFVGRLSPQKNVSALLTALSDLDIKAIIIGNGELRDELQSQFGDLNGKVSWQRNIPNSKLPAMMNRSRIFILPSHYEGHPKTLIEAMSCGMPVIGADSPGIREIIRHGENGWLCGTDADSISQAIQHLLENPDLAQRLGDNARQFVLQNYALEDIVEKELKVIKKVAMVEN